MEPIRKIVSPHARARPVAGRPRLARSSLGRLRHLGLLVAAATLLPIPQPLLAQPSDGAASDEASEPSTVYLEYFAGVSFVDELDLDNANAVGAGLGGAADPQTGFVFGGAIGTHVLESLRAELQIGYSDAGIDEIQVQGEPDTGKGGISLVTVLANAYFDLDTGLGITPWVGAGIGWGLAEFEARNSSGALQLEVDDTDSVFVWNVMAGAMLPISETVAWSLGYRYIASEEMTLKSRAAGVPVRLETDWSAHQLTTGMRLSF